MNGDHYEEETCPQCGLGLATECNGHIPPSPVAPRLAKKEIDVFVHMRNEIEDLRAALLAVMSTPHFYDMPDHVQAAAKKAMERSGQ
jgi:hypothetical protein